MRITTTSLVLAVLMIACLRNGTPKKISEAEIKDTAVVLKQAYVLDSLDYVVISEAIYQYLILPPSLGHRFQDYNSTALTKRIAGIKSFVLVDSTSLIKWDTPAENRETIENYIIKEHNEKDSTDTSWIKDILIKNEKVGFIDSTNLKYIHYKVVPTEKIRKIFSTERGWRTFWNKYNGPSLLINVSIPSYNGSRDRAMIYVDYSSSGKSGVGGYLWLKNEKGKWIAYDLVEVWIS
jgi:hypothetical protein